MGSAYMGPVNGIDKREATLRAKLALKGFVLHRLEGGAFLVERWGHSRRLADLDQVQAFVQAVGA